MKTLLLNVTCLLAFCIPNKLFSATLSIVGSPVETIYVCSSSTLTDTVKITGGVAPFSYSWTNNSMATFKNDSVFSYTPSVAGVDTMICTVTDKNGISVVKKIRLYSGVESSASVTNFPTNIELPSALDPNYKKYYSFSVSPKGAKVVGIDEFKAIQQDSLYYVVSKPLYTPDSLLKAGTYHYVVVLPDSLCPVKGKADVLTVNVFQKLKITIPVTSYVLCYLDAPIGFPYTVKGGVKPYTVTIDKGGYNANTPGFYVVNYSVVDSIGNRANVIESVRIQPMEYTDIMTTKQYFNIQEKDMTLKYVSSMSFNNTFKLFDSSNILINTFYPTLSTEITIPINNLISGNYLIVAKSMSSCLSKQATFNFSLYNSPSVSIAKTETCLNDTTKVYISASGYGTQGSYTDFQTDVTFDASKLTFVGATMNNTILPNAKLLTINNAAGNITVAYNQNIDQFNTDGNLVCLKFVGIATGKSPITLVNPRIDGHSFLDSTNGEVTVRALPTIIINDTAINTNKQYTFVPVSSEVGPYNWTTPTQTNISSTTMLSTGFGWYYVTANNSYGCNSIDSANLTESTKPTISIVANNVCNGDTVEVSFNTTLLTDANNLESYVFEFTTGGLIPIEGSGSIASSINTRQDAMDADYLGHRNILSTLFGEYYEGKGQLYKMKMLAPSAGTYTIHMISATFNGNQLIANSEDATIEVFPRPTVTFNLSQNSVDGSSTPITLTGGLPLGGVYSGSGITTSPVFDPAISGYSSQIIKYTYTNEYGCINIVSDTLDISCKPTFSVVTSNVCNGDTIEVSFNTTMLKYGCGLESYVIEFNTDGLIPIVGSGTVKGSIHEGQDAMDTVYNNDYIIYGDLFGSFFDGKGKLYSMKMLAPKAGTYSITIVDAFINAQIYPQKENATITIYPSPTVQIKDTAFCINAIGNLKPKDLASGIYQWEKPGKVTEIANTVLANKQGTYSIKFTDNNSCLAYDTAIVTINDIPTITINSASICNGNSHTFIPSSSESSTYSWTLPDASTTIIRNLSTNLSGLYSVTATNSVGCSNFDTAILTVNQPKIQSLFDIAEIDTIRKTYTFTSKVNPLNLNWLLPDGMTSTDKTFEHIFTNTITGDVCLTVSDDNGCINKKCTAMTGIKPGVLISIKGTVSSKNKEYIDGVVVAYYKRGNSYIPLDSATIESDGTYSIEPLSFGTYLVKGIANDGNKYQPTYYYNAQYENKAVILNLTGNATSVDIVMNQAITGIQLNEMYSMVVLSNNSKEYAEIKINSTDIDKLMIVSMLGQIIYTTENPELTTYISKQNVGVGTYVVLGFKDGNIVQTKYMFIQ